MTAKRAKKKPPPREHIDLACMYTVERDVAGELVLNWVCDECEAKYNRDGLTPRTFLGPEAYATFDAETP